MTFNIFVRGARAGILSSMILVFPTGRGLGAGEGRELEAVEEAQLSPFIPGGDEAAIRREAFFGIYSRKPFPKDGAWLPVGQAQLNYWQGRDEEGDQEVLQWAADMADAGSDIAKTESIDFHWRAFHWARLGLLFGREGLYRPGAMSPQAEQALKETLWEYMRPRATADILDSANDWKLWKSENHHLQAWSSLWASARLLATDPEFRDRKLADGSSVADSKNGLDSYFKRWIRNRAACGLFVECNSPTYTKYSLGGFYNMADLADDAELRTLAREFLDLFWTQWVIEQVDGVRGGSRHRSYAGDASIIGDGTKDFAWYHFPMPGGPPMHPAGWVAITSSYQPPGFVAELLAERKSIGVWQTITRLPGRLDPTRHRAPTFTTETGHPFHSPRGDYQLDPASPSILRQTYSTPDFVSGFSMVEQLTKEEWSAVSSQNRWDGVVFSGAGDPRVFFQPALLKRGTGSHYNTNWSVADQGVAIVQRLPGSDAQDQRVFFSSALKVSESDGWLFAEADGAYLAIKVVNSGWRWEDDNADLWREKNKFRPGLGRWLVAESAESPIVFEVARKSDFESMEAFRRQILANPLGMRDEIVEYTSGHYDTRLSLPTQQQAPPQVNGLPLDYRNAPPYAGDVLQTGKDPTRIVFDLNEIRHEFNFSQQAAGTE